MGGRSKGSEQTAPVGLALVRADLHAHTRFSSAPVFKALAFTGCPESYSEPERVYDLARARGMDFVAVTDHDTIEGAQALLRRGLEGVIVGEEVTTRFPEDGCALHVLLWGLVAEQHEQIGHLGLREDVYAFASWVQDQGLAHAVAHPLHAQNGKLARSHIERLPLLFRGFEALNGAHGGLRDLTGRWLGSLTSERIGEWSKKHALTPLYGAAPSFVRTAGSDDHALLNVGRAWTGVERLGTTQDDEPSVFLDRVMSGGGRVGGVEGGPDTLAHQIIAVGAQHYARAFAPPKSPRRRMAASRLCRIAGADLAPPSPRSLALQALRRKIAGKNPRKMSFLPTVGRALAETLERHERVRTLADPALWADGPAIAQHERMRSFTDDLLRTVSRRFVGGAREGLRDRYTRSLTEAATGVAAAHLAQGPYAVSLYYQNKDGDLHTQLDAALPGAEDRVTHRPLRVAVYSDTLAEVNGVARFVRMIGEWAGREGRELRVFTSTCADVSALGFAENFEPIETFETPGYAEQRLALPPALPMLRAAHEWRPDVVHVSTPGPVGLVGLATAGMLRAPVIATHHTDFPAYVERLLGDRSLTSVCRRGLSWLYARMDRVVTRSASYAEQLALLGVPRERVEHIPPGVDAGAFRPDLRDAALCREHGLSEESVKLLYVGRVSREKNTALLADIWTRVRRRCEAQGQRAELIVVGDGPDRERLEASIGRDGACFLGYRYGEELARLYASSDVFLFPSVTDTLGQVVMEAQASGLPALVSDRGGPREVVADGASGFTLPAHRSSAWADAAMRLIANAGLRERMGAEARRRMETRSFGATFQKFWALHERAHARRLARLGIGWSSPISEGAAGASAFAGAAPRAEEVAQ